MSRWFQASDEIWASFFFFFQDQIVSHLYSTRLPKFINENRFKCAIVEKYILNGQRVTIFKDRNDG